MDRPINICVGTVGQGIYHSPDSGESWTHIRDPLWLESQVRPITLDPNDPSTIYAGDDTGVFRTRDGGANWQRLNFPSKLTRDHEKAAGPVPGYGPEPIMSTLHVWSIAVDPRDANTIYVGTRPSYVYRTRDGGDTWEQLPVDLPKECKFGTTRVLTMLVDPTDSDTVWVGVEIGGVFQTRDGGRSWRRVNLVNQDADGLDPEPNLDVHSIISNGAEDHTIIISTVDQVFATKDRGDSFYRVVGSKDFPIPYCRCLAVKLDDPNVWFLGNGDSAVGTVGLIQRSIDGGKSWNPCPLPVEQTNSNFFMFATNPTDPNLILASTLFGEVYRSDDAGGSWKKLKREFNEVRGLAWAPAAG